ncbi:BatD family protein [Flavobacterium sp. SUN052]|uniref:BatD family protein n=1 Tax=Flavobacterium sp. SUN052 TaxID=3002441 RepID=UPI00237EDF44|nr:BatD family protein [Flavobacterium sp. SUN052]MEC4004292.1 BatD family protein [Flavobacterium sp. SUN052]
MKCFQLLIVIIFSQSLFAQVEFKCVVEAKNIAPNDYFAVDFILNKESEDFTPPDFKKLGLELIYGPTNSTDQTTINNSTTLTIKRGYIVKASKKGTYTIESATAKIDGETYKSNTLEVEIQNTKIDSDLFNDYYLVAEVDKGDYCYYNTEPIMLSYKIYFNKDLHIASYQFLNQPNYNDLVTKEYLYDKPQGYNEMYLGKSYYSSVLKKVIIYPNEIGEFEFDSLAVTIRIKKFDKKIKGKKQTFKIITKNVFSNKPKVNICDLLPRNQPDSYSGGYGKFTIKVVKPTKELIVNKPFDVKIEISGDGNFDGFVFPELNLIPSVVESDYDLKIIKTNITIDSQEQSNSKFGILAKQTKTVTLKSAVKGEQIIAPINFSFFNPETNAYETLKTKEIVLDIK